MRPVFVVGCQRSGSTMLGAMLGGHRHCICVPESSFLTEVLPDCRKPETQDVKEIIAKIESHWRFQAWNFDISGKRPVDSKAESAFRGVIEWLVGQYAASLGHPNATVWIEQEPNHIRALWRLNQHFPDAKIVHLIRDGRAVAASLMARDWGPNEIPGAAAYWQSRIASGLAAGLYFGEKRLIHVRYEDIVQKPEQEIQRIARFLNLDFDPAMLAPVGLLLPDFTRYQHGLIGKPLTVSRVDAWCKELSDRQIEIFEGLAGDLLPYLGYRLLTGPDRRRLTELEKLSLYARDYVKRAFNQTSYKWRRRSVLS